MNRILTIISEYNPFHYGHLYHLNKSIELTKPDYKIAIISGNFVQRGEPSIINKWEKAKIALKNGFDLVIELPCIYSISSAENFANGAIKIANQIGTTHLSFGSENGNIDDLKELTTLIAKNETTYVKKVKETISQGYSYPKAQELVISELFNSKFNNICTPNNILALEYLKSIETTKSHIIPITIKRNTSFLSSSNIRSLLKENNSTYKTSLPPESLEILDQNIQTGQIILSLKEYEKEILFTLRKMNIEDLKHIPEISNNLLTKFKNASNSCNTLEDLIRTLKNKSITQARLQRILLYILLNISKQDMELSRKTVPYIRILGLNKKGKKLLSIISASTPNLITSVKKFENTCQNANLLKLLSIDKLATDIYTLAYKSESKSNLDYTTKIIEN